MSLFHGSVAIPVVADIDNSDVQRWAARAEQDDTSYEQLRDATLFDFTAEEDLLLFIRLMSGMKVVVNVCLRGQQYVTNNAYCNWYGDFMYYMH